MPSPELGAGPGDSELQLQPVAMSEIDRMAIIVTNNTNSLSNFLIINTPDCFVC